MNEDNLESIENQEPEAKADQTVPVAEHTVNETVPDGSADLGVDEKAVEDLYVDTDTDEVFPEDAADLSDTIVSGRGRTLCWRSRTTTAQWISMTG